MLLIPGAEWDFSDPVYHILSIGTESDFGYSEGCSIRELIHHSTLTYGQLKER